MSEPLWLTAHDVIALHGEQLAIFGGPAGLRDRVMLESAVGRPRHKWSYGETDLATLAAAYGFGLARNHAFVDGNKRAAFAATLVFLRLNAVSFAPDVGLATAAMQALAASEIDEADFARWIKDHWPKP